MTAVASALAAEAPGVTRAAAAPTSPAMRRPDASSNSGRSKARAFSSVIAAQTVGERLAPPRSV